MNLLSIASRSLAARSPRSLVRSIAPVAALTLLGACNSLIDTGPTQERRFGAVAIRAQGGTGGTISATPTAIFFSALQANIPDSRNASGQCITSEIDVAPPNPTGNLRAGSALQLTVRGNTLNLPVTESLLRYTLPSAGAFTYAVGDSARITVPGEAGGFPASVVSVRLAEPVFVQQVTTPPANTPMVVRWNSNGDNNSSMILSLQFGFGVNPVDANAQVLCVAPDTGSFEIPGSLLGEYLSSPLVLRRLVLQRWRTNFASLDDLTLLHVVSSVDTSLVPTP